MAYERITLKLSDLCDVGGKLGISYKGAILHLTINNKKLANNIPTYKLNEFLNKQYDWTIRDNQDNTQTLKLKKIIN